MKKLLLLLFITTHLFAQSSIKNPVVYSALGDNIYNNAQNINNLQYIKEYKVYEDKIIKYTADVNDAKKMGYAIEKGDKNISKSKYLNKLRTLSKLNDFFIKNVKNNFKTSLRDEDNKLFVNSVDSGLLNIKRYKKSIRTYYYRHEDGIDEYGSVLSKLINCDDSKKVKKKVYTGKTKQQKLDEKMRRIRKKDKDKQEAMQKSLEDELIKKKANIRKVQKEELESTAK